MKSVKVFIGIMMTFLMLISMLPATYAVAKDSTPSIQAIPSSATIYGPSHYDSGVLQADRNDYMMASENPLAQDIANNVFQGPGILSNNPTVGYMKDIYLNITHAGTIAYFNYTGEGYYFPAGHPWAGNWSGDRPLGAPEYRWLNIFDPDSQATHEARSIPWSGAPVTWEPLEGWAIAYTLEAGDYRFDPDDEGYLVVTYSGFDETSSFYDLQPNVIGHDLDDNWSVNVVAFEKWVDNPRLVVYHIKVTATNYGHPTGNNIYMPTFNIHTLIVFNKATKFIEVWTKAYLKEIYNLTGKTNVEFQFQLSRMAIIDANPACDWAFYGWKFVNITYNGTIDPVAFITLTYINESLTNTTDYWDPSWDYYAAYMLAYPVLPADLEEDGTTFTYAIGSVIPTTFTRLSPSPSPGYYIWHQPFLTTSSNYANFTALDMEELPGLKPMGDQALVRYEWFKAGAVPGANLTDKTAAGMYIDWKLTMYGVYDVAPKYWGGEAGPFDNGEVYLSNGTRLVPPGDSIHNGTLGYLNGLLNITELLVVEDFLEKNVTALDLDRNGTIEINITAPDTDEFNLTRTWLPTEELLWQLYWKFAPPTFSKLSDSCFCNGTIKWDFAVTGAPGRVTDSLGAAWLNARFAAHFVLFDVNAINGTDDLLSSTSRLTPYLMLTLTPIGLGEDYATRKTHYLTADGRAFLQMHFTDNPDTPWRDVHYLVISTAGPRPNLATYYFNDFTTMVLPFGGDYLGYLIILPYEKPFDYAPYAGRTNSTGLGIIAVARDHFNNYGLVVYGITAVDTYWTAWFLYNNWSTIQATHGPAQALLVFINYISGSVFPAGTNVPIADPNFPTLNNVPDIQIAACSNDYMSNWIIPLP